MTTEAVSPAQQTGNAPARTAVHPLIVAAMLFAGLLAAWLPTLHRLEFYNSIENIIVETALEARRDVHWLIPRMLGEPRTRKPPLATWASAVSTRPQTVRELSAPATRDAAYVRLAREMRLPALLAACFTVVAAGELGRVLGGASVGLATALITATSLLFLEYARLATPDTHLAMWVTCCNVMLAHAVLGGRRRLGCCVAGACLGLAMMSKGPVALLQTVVPVAVFLLTRRSTPASARGPSRVLPALAGAAVFLCVALPWPLLMMAEVPGVWRTWFGEVTRVDAADPRPDRWYAYVQIVRHFVPWTAWLMLGLAAAVVSIRRRERNPAELAFWLLVVPIVVMSCFSERKPRYLLPLIPPGAVLAAWALVHVLRGGAAGRPRLRRTYVALHFALLAGGAVVGALLFARQAGGAGRLPALAWPAGAVLLTAILWLLCVLLMRRRPHEWPLLAITVAAVLALDVPYATGILRTQATRSDMKPLADAIVAARVKPDAHVVSYWESDPANNAPLDLSIYLNRVVAPVPAVDGVAGGSVVVIGRPAKSGVPEQPAGWTYLGSAARGAMAWHAFVTSAGAAE